MLALARRDSAGTLLSGHLYLSDPLVQQNWVKRLRGAGFTYVLGYHDVQGKFSVIFSRLSVNEAGIMVTTPLADAIRGSRRQPATKN